MNLANQAYDKVIVDVNAGKNEFNKKILEAADKVVVSLNQNQFIITKTIEEVKSSGLEDKVVYLIGDYREDVKLTRRNIERQFGIKILGAVPSNRNVINALNSSDIVDFVNLNLDAKDHDENYELMEQLKIIIEGI